MKSLSKRERVERTLRLLETDRVPIYDLLRCDAAFEYFSGERLPVLRADEETREKLNRIVGKAVNAFLDMTRSVGFGPLQDEETKDEFGFVYRSSVREKTTWIVRRPFADESGARNYLKEAIRRIAQNLKEFPSQAKSYRENYHRDFLKCQETIGDTVNLLAQQGTGLDDLRHQLGFDLFCYLEQDEPGLVSEYLELRTRMNVVICQTIADRQLSPVVLTYGDIACKQRLLHSPAFLRREFFPRLKRLNDAWHEHGLVCLFHSDGYLMEVMDDLVAAGIDGLNPIETVAGMSLKELKERYGNKIFLAGGIDISQLMALKSPEEVKEVCRQAIKDAYPGYFIGS
ncbi:MAG: hypothetical protein NC823_00995, partial [Candidatus Omnitrophica bacterium]|nr:hypothetical protein [Candidatus Omnitrophota bacterium]